MVTQAIELPNGKVVEIRVTPGLEIQEGDQVSLKFIANHILVRTTHVEMDGERYEVPIDVDSGVFIDKLAWAHQLGVSMEEVDAMIANRKLIVKPEGKPMTSEEEGIMSRLLRTIPKFKSFLRSERPDLHGAETVHDRTEKLPSKSREIEPGDTDSSSYPRRSPLSESNPVPQGKVERQAPLPSEPPTALSQEAQVRDRLSSERFSRAKALLDEYGPEEGLRRLRATDPDAAAQFERDRHERKMNIEP